MKLLITLSILALSCNNLNKSHAIIDYITIKHTGMEEYPIATLLISTKEINKDSFVKVTTNGKTITADEKYYILNVYYNFTVTDSTTYQSIIDFCNHNQQFFTNDSNQNHGDYNDYSIKIEGENHGIFYKLKDQFLDKLISYIKTKNGDKSVIEKLATYY